jgi:hypothetical protein
MFSDLSSHFNMKRYAAIEAETKFITRNEEEIIYIHEGSFILL